MSTCRARWAGSPACSRCGSIPARSISTRRWRAAPALGRALKRIKEQLRALPDNGLGYGLLRYLNRETACAACAALRRRRSASTIWAALRRRRRRTGARPPRRRGCGGGDPAMPLAHALEVNALTLDGAEGAELTATWSWAPALVTRGGGSRSGASAGSRRWRRWCAMRRRPAPAAAARPICRWWRCRRPRSSGWSSDYPQIEDILPLSPLQEGLLFHALYDAQAPDVYTVQLELRSGGAARRRGAAGGGAGAGAAPCEPAGGFRHDDLSRPVQVIVPQVDGALAQHRSVLAG